MKKITAKQYIFLFSYPIAHLAVIVLCFLASDLLGKWDSLVFDVLFMAVLLLIAPVLAFPAKLTQINTLFPGWHPAAISILAYTVIFLLYALPFLLIYKKRKNR